MSTNMSAKNRQIKQEIWMLSRYVSAVFSRRLTAILLIPALFYLNYTILYIICMILLIPLLIRLFATVTGGNPEQEESTIFPHIREKYHFSFSKYQAEKRANPFILLLLILWQCRMTSADLVTFWKLYPGLLVLINILCRILGSFLFRIYLHRSFLHLDLLDD